MKIFLYSIIFLSFSCYAQVQPAMLSLQGIGGDGNDQFLNGVIKTSDGGFILKMETSSNPGTGNINSFCSSPSGAASFSKFNADASIMEWSKCYAYNGDSFLEYIFPHDDGSTIIGGQFRSYGFLISKHDAADHILWQKNYSKGKGAALKGMIATEDGYLMLGTSLYTDTNVLIHYGSWMDQDLWLLKVDTNGNKVWSIVIGGSGNEEAFALIPGPDGSCYVLGETSSNDHDCTGFHGGITDAYVARVNADGNIMWHRDLGGSRNEGYDGYGVENGSGGVLLAVAAESYDGDVHGHIGDFDYWVVELDQDGNIIKENCYGTPDREIPKSICRGSDGSTWVNGWSVSGWDDAYIVHAANSGDFFSSLTLGGTRQDRGSLICPLSGGVVLAGGYYTYNDGDFSSLPSYGTFPSVDAFLSRLAPWTTTTNDVVNKNTELTLFPNPANNILNIRLEQKDIKTHDIVISDLLGRHVYEKKDINDTQIAIDVSKFPNGIYYVYVSDKNGNVIMQKVLIR